MAIPAQSGLYFVTLRGEALVSVNDNNSAIRDRCIRVSHLNCKLGRARNLRARYRAYCKTFSLARVDFRVLSDHPEAYDAEAALLAEFLQWRMRGSSGRLNEWLADIAPDIVFERAERFCGLHFGNPDADPAPSAKSASPALLPLAKASALGTHTVRKPGDYRPSEMVLLLQQARDSGMTVEQLRKLHHLPRHRETFDKAINHFSGTGQMRGTNQRYAARLDFVIRETRLGASFESVLVQALARFPK